MAKTEPKTDRWVQRMLEDARIKFTEQGSDNLQINEALKSASKKGTGNVGYPDFVAVVDDFAVVIEDKPAVRYHCMSLDDGTISQEVRDVTDYAVNGALFYGKHIAQNSPFRKVFAVGVSGTEKMHHITPIYVDDRDGYKRLDDIESLHSFSRQNIIEYYTRLVLDEKTPDEKTVEDIIKDAKELHEYLRTYGMLKDQDKPLVVSGILLALDDPSFDVSQLKGDDTNIDGDLVFQAIKRRLKSSNVGPDAKRDKLMSEFDIIRTSTRMNAVDETLGKTPIRFYTEYLHDRVFNCIKYKSSSEDFIGRFYSEFMSYSGGDGQSLGIVLTPAHICDLFCELLDVRPDDVVLDPCCGAAGYLVAAMHHMVSSVDDEQKRKLIKKKQLHGYELQPNMFAIACTNMILRDDGNSNIQCEDFLKQNPAMVQQKGATVGMMNPPYSQGTTNDPSQFEIAFVEKLLDSLTVGARAAVIVPQSSMTGKTKDERAFKANILKHHTLEGVITCNPKTFGNGRVGTDPVIAVFTSHEPHPKDKVCKFIDFREDGYRIHPHVGLVEEADAVDRKARLLAVWRGEQESPTSFCVESTIERPTPPFDKDHKGDEWLHSFYYFNDAIPSDDDFEQAIGDFLTFEFSMVMQNRMRPSSDGDDSAPGYRKFVTRRLSTAEHRDIPALDEIEWMPIELASVFDPVRGREANMAKLASGDIPLISAKNCNNGLKGFVGNPGLVVKGNIITLNNDGDGGAGLAFYQPMDMALDTHVTALVPKREISFYAQIFMARCISSMHGFFGHGRSISNERVHRTRVMMPATAEGEPDYSYMEQYTMNMMLLKYEQYMSYSGDR